MQLSVRTLYSLLVWQACKQGCLKLPWLSRRGNPSAEVFTLGCAQGCAFCINQLHPGT